MPIKSNFLSNNIVKTFNLRWGISNAAPVKIKKWVLALWESSNTPINKAGNYMEKEKHQSYLFGITPVGSPISSFNKYFLAFFNTNAP